MSEMKLTKRQEAQIYCIKHGHAKYFWSFFGYAHCGRCGEQIGDSLAGVFSGEVGLPITVFILLKPAFNKNSFNISVEKS